MQTRKVNWSRRSFLGASITAAAAGASVDRGSHSVASSSSMLQVNFEKLISRADLDYSDPVSRSEEGLPIGTGSVGSLVWTDANSLKMQINRVDVFAADGRSHSFPERHSDYSCGCGYVDIEFMNTGDHIFSGQAFHQHLSVYDGIVTSKGTGITTRAVAWQRGDVIAVEINDGRSTPAPIQINLRMLRFLRQYHGGKNFDLTSRRIVELQTRNHTAASKLDIRLGRVVLTQTFREADYFNSSAVVVGVSGREARATYADESSVRLTVAPGKGRFTVLIASASTFEPNQDIVALATSQIDGAGEKGFDGLLKENRQWWVDFWSRSFIHLHSADGSADFVEQNYVYLLYLMASASRGKYPPRFGGLVWGTNGDLREWGSQHWWHNLSCYCDALPPTNRLELLDPMFRMYSGMYQASSTAAQQQWGSQGVFIPETVWFDGLEPMPDDIAAEMRELYLLRKPWAERSERFRNFASTKHPHSSRWNWRGQGSWVDGLWVEKEKFPGPYGEVTHILSSGVKIAYLYWLRYEYTQDTSWLRERAYPMLKGVAEFYRNYPNFRKGEDGKYHIHDVNDHEPIKGAQDTLEEMTALHYIFPTAIRAAEILGSDRELREAWKEVAQSLAPLPTNDLPDSIDPQQPGEPRKWTNGRKPVFAGTPTRGRDHLLIPAIHYGYCTVHSHDPDLLKIANATYDSVFPGGVHLDTPVSVLSRASVAAANLGRGEDLKHLLPNQIKALHPERDFVDWMGGGKSGVLRNRFTIREGPGNVDAQRIGRASTALHAALLQTAPVRPGGDPVLHVFAAWPVEWEAAFTLLAPGAFLVTSSMRNGQIEFVELRAQIGKVCRIWNPWSGEAVIVYRDGKKAEELRGPELTFDTKKDEVLILTRAISSPDSLKRTLLV